MHIFPNICVHRRHHPLIFVLGEQVSFVQYSDDARTEFKLNTYHDKGIVISALQGVRYRGGNTKTGEALGKKSCKLKVLTVVSVWGSMVFFSRFLLRPGIALKHVYEKVFTSDNGMRRNVPKVLVVVTDGRSQDEVKKSAEKLQHSGMCGNMNRWLVCLHLCYRRSKTGEAFAPERRFSSSEPDFLACLINSCINPRSGFLLQT